MTVLTAVTFSLGIKSIMLVPYGILVPTLCNSRPISFANEFSQISLVGPLIQFLYYRYDPIVGSMNTLA